VVYLGEMGTALIVCRLMKDELERCIIETDLGRLDQITRMTNQRDSAIQSSGPHDS
jgi:hypothetical protein